MHVQSKTILDIEGDVLKPVKIFLSLSVTRFYEFFKVGETLMLTTLDAAIRVDLSALHAYEARQSFAEELSKGEGGISLAKAALHVAAEDDALVSHSTVKLPVPQFLQRINALSNELARVHLQGHSNELEPSHALEVRSSAEPLQTQSFLFF